ncbi:MAG: dockerin type I repeat-containing protein [Clostridiales bacterium]|nr:dockerin type I repeat-containing protein [Clostridiales bacterium]
MKTTRRIISTILAVCLLASLCCTAAFADDKDSAENELVIAIPTVYENSAASGDGFIIISENRGEPTSRYTLDKDSVKWYKWDGVNESTKTEITGKQFEVGYDYDFSFVINFEKKIDSEMDLDIKLQYGDGNLTIGGCKLNNIDMHDTYCAVYGSTGTLVNESSVVGVDTDSNWDDGNSIIIGGVNVYMSNLPQVGMKIDEASQGIFACDGAVIVDSVAWLKKNPEYVHVEETISDNGSSSTEGGAYNVSKYIPVTEEVFGKDTYAVDIVLRADKDVAVFADYLIATVNGMQAADVEMKGRDTCIVTFEFWELSDAVYLNIETAEPMVGAIASNMAYIANFNSNYYIDRNTVEWYRFAPEDENLTHAELVTGKEFEFGYRYAIELYIGVLSEDNVAEDAKLHILINGRDVEYTYTKEDKSMIRVYYVYDAYDMVNVDGDQAEGVDGAAPAYKIMDSVTVGDLSGDKKVEMTDVVELQRIIAKLAEITNSADRLAADTNGDGIINMEDVTTMQKYVAKLIEKL